MQKTLLILVGPTAVGKTASTIELAKFFQTEIISADSRQVYSELLIGTARPDKIEQAGIPHHLLGHHSIQSDYTAADFVREADQKCKELFLKHDLALMTGGSGLYLDAFCNGLDDLPNSNPAIKQQLNQLLASEGIEKLQVELLRLDPDYHSQIDLNNPHRLIRAIEVCLISGKKFSELRKGKKRDHDFRIIKVGLNLERERLYERINKRVLQMLAAGLEKEVQGLYPYKHLKALKTVGYTELFDFMDGKISREMAIELIQQNSRRYAKRQLTWFRKDAEIVWFQADDPQLLLQIKALL